MANIEKFLGKAKKITINDEEVDVYPLQFNDIDVLVKFGDSDPNIRAKATRDLLLRSLKKTFPEATEEQLGTFNVQFMNELLAAVFEASGLKVDQKKLEAMTEQF